MIITTYDDDDIYEYEYIELTHYLSFFIVYSLLEAAGFVTGFRRKKPDNQKCKVIFVVFN